jgi:glycosyltransferase involved in cell wall biosynthesis
VKVAHVCLRYPPAIGGVERYVKGLVDTLRADGRSEIVVETTDHGVVARARGASARASEEGVEVTRHRCWTGRESGRYPIAPGLAPALARLDADLVHAHGQFQFSTDLAQVVARAKRQALVVSPYFHPPRTQLGLGHLRTLGRLIEHAPVVTTVSNFELSSLQRAGLRPKRVVVVPPVLRPVAPPDPSIWDRIGVDPRQRPVVLTISRAATHKQLPLLLAAMDDVRRAIPETCLVIAGSAGRADFDEDGRSVRAGVVSEAELSALYLGASVVVLVSSYETFGLVLLEALQLGTPALGPASGGPGELLAGCDSLTFPPNDASGLASRLVSLLSDPALVEDCLSWAAATVLPRFSRLSQRCALDEAYALALDSARRTMTPSRPRLAD